MMIHKSRNAFTLVEILVVVVILGIAASVVIPQIGTRSDLKASAASRIIMADLMYAQNKAIATQQRHYVKFDTAATPQSYRIVTSVTPLVDMAHPITKAASYVVNFGAAASTGLDDVSLGTVSFEGQTVLVFDELGVPHCYNTVSGITTALTTTNGSTIQVISGSVTMTITVQPYTGEIHVN